MCMLYMFSSSVHIIKSIHSRSVTPWLVCCRCLSGERDVETRPSIEMSQAPPTQISCLQAEADVVGAALSNIIRAGIAVMLFCTTVMSPLIAITLIIAAPELFQC